ncbi:MAG: molybdopterin-binding protein, partial [Ghiorsea sp.]|nr:molybdopterin-binding protein [Ghiorsea sp.]
KLAQGLQYDVLLASGGISIKHHDFVRPTLEALGMTMHFWRVAMRPGHPLAFGTSEQGAAIFGLPGNPVASMVCFEQFVAPALRQMMGQKKCFLRTIEARLSHDMKGSLGKMMFIRVTLSRDEQGYVATSTGAQGSGVLMSMALAEGLLAIPADKAGLKAGELASVQLLQNMDVQDAADMEI